MLRNVESLTPKDGRHWQEARQRITACPDLGAVLARLDEGNSAGLGKLRLKSSSSADCFIECERALIWIDDNQPDPANVDQHEGVVKYELIHGQLGSSGQIQRRADADIRRNRFKCCGAIGKHEAGRAPDR